MDGGGSWWWWWDLRWLHDFVAMWSGLVRGRERESDARVEQETRPRESCSSTSLALLPVPSQIHNIHQQVHHTTTLSSLANLLLPAVQTDLDFLNSLPSSTTTSNGNGTAASTTTTVTSDESNSSAPTSTVPPTLPADSPLAPLFNSLSLSLPTDPTDDESEESGLDEESINALLAKMEQADLAADGLEGRLDSLLKSLDGMLGALGADVGEALSGVEEEEGAGTLAEEDGEKKVTELE